MLPKILDFITQVRGYCPEIEDLEKLLTLSYASARKAWYYFRQCVQNNQAFVQALYDRFGFEFLKKYIQTDVLPQVPEVAQREKLPEPANSPLQNLWSTARGEILKTIQCYRHHLQKIVLGDQRQGKTSFISRVFASSLSNLESSIRGSPLNLRMSPCPVPL